MPHALHLHPHVTRVHSLRNQDQGIKTMHRRNFTCALSFALSNDIKGRGKEFSYSIAIQWGMKACSVNVSHTSVVSYSGRWTTNSEHIVKGGFHILPVQLTADTLHYNHVHASTHMYTYVYWHIPLIHTYRMGRLPSTLQQPVDMRMFLNYCLKQTWIQIYKMR